MSDEYDDKPTELSINEINNFFDIKLQKCLECDKECFPSYGSHVAQCDECFFSHFNLPKEDVKSLAAVILEFLMTQH